MWFAHAVPYTFTNLQTKLKEIVSDEKNNTIVKAELLAFTLSGMPVPLLTITDNINSYITYED